MLPRSLLAKGRTHKGAVISEVIRPMLGLIAVGKDNPCCAGIDVFFLSIGPPNIPV